MIKTINKDEAAKPTGITIKSDGINSQGRTASNLFSLFVFFSPVTKFVGSESFIAIISPDFPRVINTVKCSTARNYYYVWVLH